MKQLNLLANKDASVSEHVFKISCVWYRQQKLEKVMDQEGLADEEVSFWDIPNVCLHLHEPSYWLLLAALRNDNLPCVKHLLSFQACLYLRIKYFDFCDWLIYFCTFLLVLQKRIRRSEHARKETEFLRLKRTRLGLEDFESLKVIGRGAFGEVRVPCHRRHHKRKLIVCVCLRCSHLYFY